MEFYAYIYYDPTRNNEPFYVGKGKGERAWSHLKESHNFMVNRRINAIRELDYEPEIEIVPCGSEASAFEMEKTLVSKYGRRNLKTGSLWNFTDGGDGGSGIACFVLKTQRARKEAKKAYFSRRRQERLEKMSIDAREKLLSDKKEISAQKSLLAKQRRERKKEERLAKKAEEERLLIDGFNKSPYIIVKRNGADIRVPI